MKSPCIKICKLQNNICIGCARTIFQIANWKKFTDEERKLILKEIK